MPIPLSLTLRVVNNPPLITKGSALNYEEMDGNLINIYNYLTALSSDTKFTAYDPTKAYAAGLVFVVFDDGDGEAIYRCIRPCIAGQSPLTTPANWLKEGETFVKLTKVQAQALIDGPGLSTKKLYEITDAVSGAKKILAFGWAPGAVSRVAINLTDNTFGNYNFAADTFAPLLDYPTWLATLPGYVANRDGQIAVMKDDGTFIAATVVYAP